MSIAYPIYTVYSYELGYPPSNPYHETDDKEEAEIVCKTTAHNKNVQVYVLDNIKGKDVYCTIPSFIMKI